jgi:hypothetical protein
MGLALWAIKLDPVSCLRERKLVLDRSNLIVSKLPNLIACDSSDPADFLRDTNVVSSREEGKSGLA